MGCAATYQAVAAAAKQDKLRKERDAARQEDMEKALKRREGKKNRTAGLVSPSARTPRPADQQDGAQLLFPDKPVSPQKSCCISRAPFIVMQHQLDASATFGMRWLHHCCMKALPSCEYFTAIVLWAPYPLETTFSPYKVSGRNLQLLLCMSSIYHPLLVSVGNKCSPDAVFVQESGVFVEAHIARVLKPHQWEGVRFLWEQIVMAELEVHEKQACHHMLTPLAACLRHPAHPKLAYNHFRSCAAWMAFKFITFTFLNAPVLLIPLECSMLFNPCSCLEIILTKYGMTTS